MRYIAHRGNLIGPCPDLENRPEYIMNALDLGFDCECDVWWHNDGWWLGHDAPQYQIGGEFLTHGGLWIHAKNVEALDRLKRFVNLNYFWHDTDDYTLTSLGFIWAYPGSTLTSETVCVMPELAKPPYKPEEKARTWAICSDYIIFEKLEEIRRNT